MDGGRTRDRFSGGRAPLHHEESVGDEKSGTVSPPSPSSSIHTSPPPLPLHSQRARRMTHYTNASSATSLSVTGAAPPPPHHCEHNTPYSSDNVHRVEPSITERADRMPKVASVQVRDSDGRECIKIPPSPDPTLPQLREPLLKPQLPQLVDTTHFRVLHPYGFRLLRDRSVIERSLRGYFRLPPAPSVHLQAERDRLRRTLRRMAHEERQKLVATLSAEATTESGVVLDGFLLLSAAAKGDPVEVESVTLQASHLVDTVAEDLAYFTGLFFLDVSENALRLEDMLPLTALETLHMAYNQISSLQGLQSAVEEHHNSVLPTPPAATDDGGPLADTTAASTNGGTSRSSVMHDVVFPNMLALNLSYNVIPYHDITLLAHLPCLEKLDLSGNRLRRLPADLSTLSSVTHFALEGNLFTSRCARGVRDGPMIDVFLSLATMPSLVEVNLNHNRLSCVPPLSVNDGHGLCFPCIETIGISDNLFHKPQSLLPLAALHRTLRRVVLTDNPVARHALDMQRARVLFDRAVVDAYYERTTKDSQSRSASVPTSASRSRKMYEEAAVAAVPSPTSGGTSSVRPPSSTDLGWQGEEWCRLIPCRSDDDGEGDEHGTGVRTRTLDISAAAAAAAAAAAREAMDDAAGSQATPAHCDDAVDGGETLNVPYSTNGHDDGDGHAFHCTGHTSIRDFFATAEDYLQHHRVELIVHAASMPRRALRYFYATQTHVAGRSALVSLPPYTEFMDIYRLVRGHAGSRRAHEPSRPRAAGFDDVRVELPKGLRTPTVETSTVQEMNSVSSLDVAIPVADHSGTSFFITGTDVAMAPRQSPARPSCREKVSSGEKTGGHHVGVLGTSVKCATQEMAGPLLQSVVSPGTINVRSAVTELRAMLRKPLPALPFPVAHTTHARH